jgi:3-hydroxyacyl-CoA dehydrogenase
MFVFKAAVVGAGTMGGEIAQVVASAGIPVVLKDVDERHLETGLKAARAVWQARVDAGRLPQEEMDRQYALIEPTTAYDGFGDVDLVIEAVPERIELKVAVFAELDAVTPGHAILATNTSALSITEIGDATTRPEQVVGLHFFYPASAARVVEVVEGEYTAPETAQAAANFAQAIRRTPIRCGEQPGFIVNRILAAGMSEAFRHQVDTGAPLSEVDRTLTDSGAAPIGPFALADRLGLDTVLHVASFLRESYGESFFVHPLLEERVAAGDLGRKTGRGFHEYR